MGETTISCEVVDQRDLDTRYLAGTLDPAEAEEFEAHFFGCDRCWALVQRGLEARAAFSGGGIPLRRPIRGQWWWLAAAAVAFVFAGAGLYRGFAGRGSPDDNVTRGTDVQLVVLPGSHGDTLLAAWNRIPQAARYRARLYTTDGDLIFERTTADTVLAVAPASLPSHSAGRELRWEVQAVNTVGTVLGRSGLVPASHAP